MRRVRAINDERGAAAVLFLLTVPLFLLFLAFVVNTARWWVVSRHMQTQADAAAFAAGTELAMNPVNCTRARVENRAKQYAGIETAVPGESQHKYNSPGQVNTKNAATTYDPNFRLNSATYAEGGGSDPDAGSFTGIDSSGKDRSNPCNSGIADIKLTTTDVPPILKAINIASNVRAHARVQLLKASIPSDTAPFGVETSDPKQVYVELVDLSNGASVSVYKPDGTAVTGFNLNKGSIIDGNVDWASIGEYQLRSSAAGRLGLRVRVSDSNTTVTCGDAPVHCYGSLDTIRVFKDPNASGAFGVRLGAVVVAPSSATGVCDPAAGEVGTFTTTCTAMNVTANLAGLNTSQTVVVKANGTTLTSLGSGRWGGDVPITVGSGANEITIDWSQKGGSITTATGTQSCPNNNPCTGTFSNVHRAFAAKFANAGAIKHVTTVIGTGTYAAQNNVQESTCSAATPCAVSIDARLGGSVALSKPGDPAIALRLGDSGSLTGLLDCDPDESQTDREIAVGCGKGRYTENKGTACPSSASDLWKSPLKWQCIASEQGNRVSQIAPGITAHVLCQGHELDCLGPHAAPTCDAHNHWPTVTDGDPRILPMFLVPLGSSEGSGSSVFPILGAAAFYVTGWTNSPCTGADNEIPAKYAKDKASVFGHWIIDITLDAGGDEGVPCDLSTLTICTPVLVK